MGKMKCVYKSRRRKRTKSKRGNVLAKVAKIKYQPTPFPQVMRTRVNFTEAVIFNPAAIAGSYQWNANSLFDPNRTGGGKQPFFYDELCTANGPYYRYRVRGLKYKFLITGANTPLRWTIGPYNNTNPASYDQLAQMIGSKEGVINAMSNGGTTSNKCSGYFRVRDVLGEDVIANHTDGAIYSTNPSNLVLLGLRVECLDGVTNISNLNIIVDFWYYCDFYDTEAPPESA